MQIIKFAFLYDKYPTNFECLRVFASQPWIVSLLGENAVDAGAIYAEIEHPAVGLFVSPPNSKQHEGDIETIPTLTNRTKMIATCCITNQPFYFKFAKYVWKAISTHP